MGSIVPTGSDFPQLFLSDNPALVYKSVGSRASVTRPFYLYLATMGFDHLTCLELFTVDWCTPEGWRRIGVIERTSCNSIAQCRCPDSKNCTAPRAANIHIGVDKCAGGPTREKASLCLWHPNRTKFAFDMHVDLALARMTIIEDQMRKNLEIMTQEYKNYKSFTPTNTTLDIAQLKAIYERNKTSETCVACGRKTQEREVFTSVIQYCSCIEVGFKSAARKEL